MRAPADFGPGRATIRLSCDGVADFPVAPSTFEVEVGGGRKIR